MKCGEAARTFTAHTAVGPVGWRPRGIALLSDQALAPLAGLFSLAEVAAYPRGELVDIVFLPKPGVGERPIGLIATLMRLWCRCRRKYARAWERANDRDYFWAAEARSSEEAVHHQGLTMEAARARGLFCAAVLTDLMKAYEHVLHSKLIAFAKDTQFPLGLLRMCLVCYAGPRRLIVDGYCTGQFCIGGKSLIAGCGFATTLLKVYTIKLFDMMWRWYPELSLHVFVDDVDMNTTTDTEEASFREVANGTQRLLTEFKSSGAQAWHKQVCLSRFHPRDSKPSRFVYGCPSARAAHRG